MTPGTVWELMFMLDFRKRRSLQARIKDCREKVAGICPLFINNIAYLVLPVFHNIQISDFMLGYNQNY